MNNMNGWVNVGTDDDDDNEGGVMLVIAAPVKVIIFVDDDGVGDERVVLKKKLCTKNKCKTKCVSCKNYCKHFQDFYNIYNKKRIK